MAIPENVDVIHCIHLEWAPWERDLDVKIPHSGIVVATGKATDDDGYSRTLNISSDKPVFTLFGAGEVDDEERMLNIRRGWRIGDQGASEAEREHGPSHDTGLEGS